MSKSIKKFSIFILTILLFLSSIYLPVNAVELNADIDKTPPADAIYEEEVIVDTTNQNTDRDVSDEEIEDKYKIVKDTNNEEKNVNIEQNQEESNEVVETNTPDGMQELTVDENTSTGFVFIEVQTAKDFNYQLKAVVLNTQTNQFKTIPIYSTNNYIGKQELPIGEYKLVEVSVPNDLKGEFQFESGQTFEITDGASIRIKSKQSDLIEVKEEPKKEEVNKETKNEEKKDNSILNFIKEYIVVIIIVVVIAIFAKIVYDKTQEMSDDE